jgi:hypothetical protein
MTPDTIWQTLGPLQELLPTVVTVAKFEQARGPLQELSPTVAPEFNC